MVSDVAYWLVHCLPWSGILFRSISCRIEHDRKFPWIGVILFKSYGALKQQCTRISFSQPYWGERLCARAYVIINMKRPITYIRSCLLEINYKFTTDWIIHARCVLLMAVYNKCDSAVKKKLLTQNWSSFCVCVCAWRERASERTGE